MFETHFTPRVTPAALGAPNIDQEYYRCWLGLKSHFTHPDMGAFAAHAGDGTEGAALQQGGKPGAGQPAVSGTNGTS